MLRVLWLTAEVPDAGLSGGNIRQYHLLSALATHAHVDLAVVGGRVDDALRARLDRVHEFPQPPVKHPPARMWQRRAADLWTAIAAHESFEVAATRAARALLEPIARSSNHDVVIVEHGYLAPLRDARPGRWILTFHNLDSERSRQHAAVAPGRRQAWVWERDAARARKLERWALEAYDRVIAVSEEDAQLLGGAVTVIPNGVDLDHFAATPLPSEARLIFTANLSYGPNIDAARWFCTEVLPRVRREVPDASLDLVGLNPTDDVRALDALPGVRIHANVPSVVPYLQAARVAVVPVRIGTGTRLKALEAMAARRPLAGTTIGLDGLGLVDGESASTADDVPGLARAIVALLTDDARAARQAAAARDLVVNYSWERICADFVREVLELAGQDR